MDSGGPKSLPLGSLTLCDINVLVYAHRKDGHPDHAQFSAWLKRSVEGPPPFGLSEAVLAGFVRIVTNPAIFKDPTPIGKALDFCQNLRLQAGAVFVQPDHAHWKIFSDLCQQVGARGKLVADAWFAALAIEHACTWISTDSDFARFPDLDWRHPLKAA